MMMRPSVFRTRFGRPFTLLAWAIIVGIPIPTRGDDWPQWLGPQRDSIWRETGIVREIPPQGLPVSWRVPVQLGYGGPAVAQGRVVVMDYVKKGEGELVNNPGGATSLTGEERVLCFAVDDGKLLWEHRYAQPYQISYPGGPRCTPTIDGEHVYTFGAEGELTCLQLKTGQVVWHRGVAKDYQTKAPIWGFAAHPLVDGDLIYVIVGGPGSVCVAFNKRTGDEVWRALTAAEPGYCPPTMIEHAGVKQLLVWHPEAICSLDPLKGSTYWSLPIQAGFGMSITAPRKLGNLLYISAIGDVSALIRLDDTKPGAEFVWRGKPKDSLYCSNSTPFLLDGMIYGSDIETGALIGASLETAERRWQTTKPTDNHPRRSRHATAFLVRHDDRFFLFNELGDLILAQLSPTGYQEQGRFHVLDPTNEAFGRPVVWSHPAFAEKSLFARNDRELVRVNLAAQP